MFTRRDFLATTAAAISAPYIVRPAKAATKTLRIITWEGYAEPEWLEPFKAANDADVSVTYAGSVDEMFAKMQGSKGSDFDIISFDTSSFARYIQAGLIQPLDLAKLPNAANVAPALASVPALSHEGKQYGIPFAWGSLPLIYDAGKFPTPPESWSVMWDAANAQQLIALDDANNNITLAALVLGFDKPFALTDAQFDAVKAKLIEQKKLLLTYYAGFDEGVTVFAESSIKAMFSMGEPQVAGLKKKGVNAAMTIPKEGAIGWLDCWEISAGAADTDLAYKWIDACLDKSVGKILSDQKSYGNVTDADANQRNGFTYADKLTFLENPENFEKRVAVWNEVKASL